MGGHPIYGEGLLMPGGGEGGGDRDSPQHQLQTLAY